MQFKDVPIGTEFIFASARYRKASERKAHLLDGAREGAGPLRFRAEQEVVTAAEQQAIDEAAKAEQAKKETGEKAASEKAAAEKVAPEKPAAKAEQAKKDK